MDDSHTLSDSKSSEPKQVAGPTPESLVERPPVAEATTSSGAVMLVGPFSQDHTALWKRNFRHNLLMLLSLTLCAFALTAWILVRVDSPFGIFSSGPQEIVRAQLRALDRGDLRPAYNMFSARYRGQVSFDAWHELIVTHWRMFHTDVLRSGTPARMGQDVTLDIYLHGADDKDYRARFTLVHAEGRWWIDDVHWAESGSERGLVLT